MKSLYINLACGSVYVDNSNWINLDYESSSKSVQQANLLQRLPLDQEIADLVYSSHFLEHIPKSKVIFFLQECFRILKPGGIIRLVLPDLEEMANNYLFFRKKEEHAKANFLVLEMIDQCVRNNSGGELGHLYKKIRKQKNQDKQMIDFIYKRTGEDLANKELEMRSANDTLLKKLNYFLSAILRRVEKYRIRIFLLALPKAFRDQNVSLAGIGELHHWLWDFYTLKKTLEVAGFVEVKRVTAKTSHIKDFPFSPLDIDNNELPRKGLESMFIEATKS